MAPVSTTGHRLLRLAFLVGGAAVLTLALLPVLLAGDPMLARAAEFLDALVLKPFCHQLPGRSAHLYGAQVGLCWRCLALLLGGLAGAAAGGLPGRWARPQARLLALAALAPLLLDVAAQHWNLYSSNSTRVATGLVTGLGVSLALLSAAAPPPEGPA
jgi:uncharacterized membrane protein